MVFPFLGMASLATAPAAARASDDGCLPQPSTLPLSVLTERAPTTALPAITSLLSVLTERAPTTALLALAALNEVITNQLIEPPPQPCLHWLR